MPRIPQRAVERFFRYCQFLHSKVEAGSEFVFSHELAAAVGVSPEQVRRDFMNFRQVKGTPQRGYPVKEFMAALYSHLESSSLTKMVLVGVGNLGKAILSYFLRRRPNLSIVAAFDLDPEKTDRIYSGCRVHHPSQLEKVVARERVAVGIITVPASVAQEAADALVRAGVKGIVNFAPANIRLPRGVFLEHIDITLALEKTAYFARSMRPSKEFHK
ncbi:MAG: redox-sensing transcriptional repressor [Elusimicrobia bacterium]|nr:MAG: redox-sensing transcriptional repressor [Elusimicrobiota bacterium]KAF0158467.1 MAG: redox-sensing transcriptional repressor [Elusimicrobiota bacterium]